MDIANALVILWNTLVPRDALYEVFLSKYLIADLSQVVKFIIGYGNKYCSILPQEISCKTEPCIHHRKPIRMKSPIGLGIRDKTIAGFVSLVRLDQKIFGRLVEFIIVDQIASGIIGWVNIDYP